MHEGPSEECYIYTECGWRKLVRKSGREEEEIFDCERGCMWRCGMVPVYCEDFLRLIWTLYSLLMMEISIHGHILGPYLPRFFLNICQDLKWIVRREMLPGKLANVRPTQGHVLCYLTGHTHASQLFGQPRWVARGYWEIGKEGQCWKHPTT